MLELRLLDKTWDEVGKELGMSGGQARLRLQRALKDLRGDRGDT
jgi:DNA-directed RNA polymerase specialized sigma24 family protein